MLDVLRLHLLVCKEKEDGFGGDDSRKASYRGEIYKFTLTFPY